MHDENLNNAEPQDVNSSTDDSPEQQALERSLSLPIKKPIKWLFRNVKIDGFGFFKALAKGAANYGTQKYWNLPSDVVEALGTVKLEPLSPAERAWLLIYRAMLKGAAELVQPSIPLLNPEESTQDALVNDLDATLLEREVTIDRAFFKHPHELDILKDFQELIYVWLTGWGLEESRAQTVIERLPIFFVAALHEEWRERSADYSPVVAAFDTPFIAATEYLLEWERYYVLLRKQVQEAMFEETFSLRQIYVPLRAYYEIEKPHPKSQERDGQPDRETEKIRVAVPLQETLDSWLNQRNRRDTLRVISGGPGSGKSSFAKMWAAELTLTSNLRVLYIPLHNFNLKSSLEEAVGNFVKQPSLFSRNPLDATDGEKELLLIFDGLDEIAERGRASADLARNFVVEVGKTLDQRNQAECRVQALIAGRELVVQSNVTHFRLPGQILHALPYKLPETEGRSEGKLSRGVEYQDEQNLLNQDQRDLWWQNYGRAIGQTFEGIPEPLQREDLEDVTAQPLLNYLVALSYKRGELDFENSNINLNQIYEDLLTGVYKRGYESKGNIHVPELEPHEFTRALEEIALSVWHGNGRTATVAEIEKHCDKSGSLALLNKFGEGAKAGVTRLLTAFYFREQGQDASGDRTFEFTHKSFGEYLTAKCIVRTMMKIVRELKRRRDSFDEGWDERRALQEWAETCGPTTLDEYVVAFLRREIALNTQAIIQNWQQEVCGLINALLKNGLPLERLETSLTFKEMLRQSRNAEEALLAFHSLSATAVENPTPSQIKWPEPTSAGEWLKRLQGQRIDPTNSITLLSLSFLNFDNQAFDVFDFYAAIFKGASFRNTRFTRADLSNADLTGTDLRDARLNITNLRGADLSDAQVDGAELSGAILDSTKGLSTDMIASTKRRISTVGNLTDNIID